MTRESEITRALHWHAGDDELFEFTIFDGNGTGALVLDITGFAFSFQAFTADSDTVLFTKTVGSGITLTDPTNGVLQVVIDAADTSALTQGTYRYRLRRTDASSVQKASFGRAFIYSDPFSLQ